MNLIMGEMMFSEDSNYLYLTDSKAEADYVYEWLMHIHHSYVGDEPLVYNANRHSQLTTVHNSRFQFAGIDNLESRVCGNTYRCVFFDISEECWRKLSEDGKIFDLHASLNSHLLPDGDIV